MGLPGGESCMILTSTVFDGSTRVTDNGTDRQTDGRQHIRAICCRAQKAYDFANVKPHDNKAKPMYCLKVKFADSITTNMNAVQ